MPLNALTHLIYKLVLAILLVRVNKSYFVLKKKYHVTKKGAGGGGHQINVTKCLQGGEEA
jgi:hypothetical protein